MQRRVTSDALRCLAWEETEEDGCDERLAREWDAGPFSWKLVAGDCRLEATWKDVPPVAAYFLSPPYNIGVNYGVDGDGAPINDLLERGEYGVALFRMFCRCRDQAGEPGAMFLNLKPLKDDPMLPFDILRVAAAAGWHLQHPFTWLKSGTTPSGPPGSPEVSWGHFQATNSRSHPHSTYEWVFLLRLKKRPEVKLNRCAPGVGVPYADKSNTTRSWKKDANGERIPLEAPKKDLRCRGDTWAIPYKTITKRTGHPCPYPVELVKMGLSMLDLPPGSTVCDPYCGSGSAGVAALQLGLQFVGMDRSPEFLAEAAERLLKA